MPFMVRKTPPNLTPSIYPAQISDIIAKEGNYGPQIQWNFELIHEGHAYRAQTYTNATFYQGSPEHRWVCIILGHELQPGETINEAELIGAPVQVKISCKPGKPGVMFYNVDEILSPKASEDSDPGDLVKKDEEDVPF